MKTVLNVEPLDYSQKAVSIWKDAGFAYNECTWEEVEVTPEFNNVEVLIVRLGRKVDSFILKKFPGLGCIVSATTGVDHISSEALHQSGIKLHCLKGHTEFLSSIPSTAELTWGLLLSLIRNIPSAVNSVKEGRWSRDIFRGEQLKGKVLGIVGMGRTGKKVASYANAFGMKIKYYDPYVPVFSAIKSEKSLIDLVCVSNIVTLHVNLNEETRYLINRDVLTYAQNGIYIINTSRGSVIKETDIRDFFLNGTLKGLATDVLDNEFDLISNNHLWKMQDEGYNVIITPHIGGATFDAMKMCEEYLADYVVKGNY